MRNHYYNMGKYIEIIFCHYTALLNIEIIGRLYDCMKNNDVDEYFLEGL